MGDGGPRLVLLGKQGAGKGTQADRLASHYRVARVSTGDMFRAAVKAETAYGLRARNYIDAGELVPDDVVFGLVDERLAEEHTSRGFVLDGFPRTVLQAEALDAMLTPQVVDLVVELTVPTDVVLARLAGRRVCVECGTNYGPDRRCALDGVCDVCGGKVVPRDDDTEAAIGRRLELYSRQTEPLVAYYLAQDRLAVVDGLGTVDTVTARLLRAIGGRLDRRS